MLAGRVQAVLVIAADAPSFDVSAVLSMVAPDGRAWNLTEGYRRVGSGEGPVVVAMRATCATVPAGHALRLSLAAANFPAFPVNPGTGTGADRARQVDARTITLRVATGSASGSRIDLPVLAIS
jgi:putative CocE/NonD family hydrolase